MKRGMKGSFKRGAASFYIIAFSTLILIIIAMSFAAVIISQVTRTSNEDLAQSAYDSALAGVEDAKLAYMSYQNCVGKAVPGQSSGADVTCGDILYWVDGNGSSDWQPDCSSVAHILGRTGKGDDGEVKVQESSQAGNNMQQAYTCAMIKTTLKDYKSTLNSANQVKVVKVKLDDVPASAIKKVKVSWYAVANTSSEDDIKYSNFTSSGNVLFPTLKDDLAVPPMLSVGLVQTGGSTFSMESFDYTKDDQTNRQTNRAMVYLVPVGDEGNKEDNKNKLRQNFGKETDTYYGAYNGSGNIVRAAQMAKSNDKTTRNLPFGVYCNTKTDAEFACSATLELPEPIGGDRNDDTFIFVVSIPYGKPSTDFALEFYCADEGCYKNSRGSVDTSSNQANLKGTQISVDSTGRANDLFRRVETRLEPADATFPYPLYALQLLDDDPSNSSLRKNLIVTSEQSTNNYQDAAP